MRRADYVQHRDGEYFVNSTRVTLRSIIADWKRGRSPEQIVADFPSIPLVAIYGAVTTYLERQQEFEQHFAKGDVAAARQKAAAERAHAPLYAEMRARVANVRPDVEAELRAQGILPEAPEAPDQAAAAPSGAPKD
jgi:uncharacterized protein (DUF433 family)